MSCKGAIIPLAHKFGVASRRLNSKTKSKTIEMEEIRLLVIDHHGQMQTT